MRFLILLLSLMGAHSALAGAGFPDLNGKLPSFFLHCEQNGGHLTIDTITGVISWANERDSKAVEYVRVTSEYPSEILSDDNRAVQYLRFDTVLDRESSGHVEYVRKNVLNELKIDSQTKVSCFVRRDSKLEQDLGVTCQLQDVLWRTQGIGRRLQSIDLHFPFQGSVSAMPAASAMIINKGPSVWTFDPAAVWTLKLEKKDSEWMPTDSSCTAFTKDN